MPLGDDPWVDRAIQEQKTQISQYQLDGRVKPSLDMICFRDRNRLEFCPSYKKTETDFLSASQIMPVIVMIAWFVAAIISWNNAFIPTKHLP
jgi:hypothetical protein